MMKLFIATLGFDEKFIIRSLIRNGLSSGDSVIIFAPKGYALDEKSAKAAEVLRDLVAKILPAIELRIEECDLRSDYAEEINRIRSLMLGCEFKEIIACLSGGMRALIIGVVSALLLLNGCRIVLEIEFETLENYVRIPLHVLKIPYDNRWLIILEHLTRRESIRALSRKIGLSAATLSRTIGEMRRRGLVDEDNNVTEDGFFYMKLYKRLFQKFEK